MLDVVVLLAVLTALVMLSNKMSTLVGEQTREIAAMKAIGARRRDIRGVYLRTAMLFGVMGAVLGAGLGILLTNLLVGFLAPLGFGVEATFGISWPVVAISAVAGLLGPPLAALPAIRRAARLPLVQALQAADSAATGTQGRLDALLRRASFLPRPAQIGLRNMGRRKRRTVATVLQVSLAVATLLALLSLGAGVGMTARAWFDQNDFQIWVQTVASKPFGPETQRTLTSTPGVGRVQPWVRNQVRVAGKDVPAWGLPAGDLMMDPAVEEGRWYSAADVRSGAKVAVLGRTLSRTSGKGVGDTIIMRTGGGPVRLRVIGISGNQAENTGVVFLPVTTLQRALGVTPGTVNAFWLQTSSPAHGRIDATTTRVEDTLAARGTQVETIVMYDAREKQIAANASLTTMITILGLIIVAISMVGLVNTITMAILERTREIGVLRSIGARAKDVRRIFATEGVAVAVAGWVLGVPLGYAFARGMVWLVGESVGLKIAFAFPPAFVLLALVGTVVLAVLVMVAPLRRAVRLRPGDALRHA